MRVSTTRFSKLKQSWELTKMTTAYINAERMIIENSNRGIDITGHDTFYKDRGVSLDNFEGAIEDLEFLKGGTPLTPSDEVWEAAKEVRAKLDEAIEKDEYVKAEMLQNVLDGLQEQYNKLKNRRK